MNQTLVSIIAEKHDVTVQKDSLMLAKEEQVRTNRDLEAVLFAERAQSASCNERSAVLELSHAEALKELNEKETRIRDLEARLEIAHGKNMELQWALENKIDLCRNLLEKERCEKQVLYKI